MNKRQTNIFNKNKNKYNMKELKKINDKKIQNLKNTDEKQTLNLLSMWLCVFHGKYTKKNKMKKQKKTPWSFTRNISSKKL